MKRSTESGFAMLFLFVMAASIAILLYMEMPRVAFESQRNKEQMLIDRGEQYQRGIQLFVKKINRYPARMEELDSTNNMRFLRRHYKDPMTGKEDWRLIHISALGTLTDSKVQQANNPLAGKDQDKSKDKIFGGSELSASTAAADPNAPPPPNMAVLQRPSDRILTPGMGTVPNSNPNDPNQPAGVPLPPGSAPPSYPGAQPGQPLQPGALPSGAPANSQNPGGTPAPFAPFPVQGAPGQTPGTPGQPNPALDAIRNSLLQPRQPPPGIGGSSFNNNQSIGGGIAGVASKVDADGIHLINDQKNYSHWEFVYDMKNDKSRLAPGQRANVPSNQPQLNQNPLGQQTSSTTTQP